MSVLTSAVSCYTPCVGDGEGAEAEDDGWNEQQEAAFQEEKQLAYEVTLASNAYMYGHFILLRMRSGDCLSSRLW